MGSPVPPLERSREWGRTAREALRRSLPLRPVHAGEGLPSDAAALPELEAPRHWARRIPRGAMDRVNERYPQVYLSADQIAQPATNALLSASEEAELLVLGSQGFSGLGGFMAGSVALSTVARVSRPVVLVRADETTEDEHPPDADGRGGDGPWPVPRRRSGRGHGASVRGTARFRLRVRGLAEHVAGGGPRLAAPAPYGYVPSAPDTGSDAEHRAR
jgi:nucleotide-binding universal stress UspA family protein